ncbi:hypothetical protein PIB30_077690 [Stylosanthes scabra]|uniref:Uncharacterized protein n=1 Tax=Stylosanthes scabra TaxID=79078 RepID=A0ABU6UPH3_9FABA|nr:hypothetical protein [Stylosanthes scabra]
MCYRAGRAIARTPRPIARLHEYASSCLCPRVRLCSCLQATALGLRSGRVTAHRDRESSYKLKQIGILWHDLGTPLVMARKGKEVVSTATSSRGRRNANSNCGREADFPNEHYESLANFEWAKKLEGMGIIHEHIIHFPDGDDDFMADRIQELDDIGRHLYIPYDLPPVGEDDIFKKTVTIYNEGNLDMGGVLEVIKREGITWANNPAYNFVIFSFLALSLATSAPILTC